MVCKIMEAYTVEIPAQSETMHNLHGHWTTSNSIKIADFYRYQGQ